MPGYTASQNSNKTWNVLDVPVFGPLAAGIRKAGGKVNPEIDRKWLMSALAKSKQRAAEDYYGPLHVRHTGDDAPKIPAGKFRLSRVSKFTYEGKEIDALFADYLEVPDETYQRFKRGELHFRSVEVFDWDAPEVNEIALLETETPYFRYGWAGIEREFPHAGTAEAWVPTRGDLASSPVAAYCAVGSGGVALFAFDDPKDKSDDAKDDKKSKDENGDGVETTCPKCGHVFSAAEDDDQDDEPKERPPVDKKDDKKPDGGAEMTALTGDVAGLRASVEKLVGEKGDLIAQLSVLQAKDRERETAKAVDGFVAKARTELVGYNFSASAEEMVRDLAAMDKPEERVTKFVALFKAHAQKDPPTSLDRAVGRAAHGGDAAELAAYATSGHLDLARECAAEFAVYSGKSFSGTLAEYLAISMPGKIRALEGAKA